jgi:hypothetical protein
VDEREYAAAELEHWERALKEQREAEYDLLVAHRAADADRERELRGEIHVLRRRADLLLAEAVRVMCVFRSGRHEDVLTDTRVAPLSPSSRSTQ